MAAAVAGLAALPQLHLVRQRQHPAPAGRAVQIADRRQAGACRLRGQRPNAALNGAIADPAVNKKLAGLGFAIVGGSPVDYGKRIACKTGRWRKVIKDADVTPPA